MPRDNFLLRESALIAFFKLWLPSIFGLLSMSTASIIDGVFIGNFVGSTPLAAVNLIAPFLGILFGFSLMLSIGGSVRAGKYIGEGKYVLAGSIFSKTLTAVFFLAIIVTIFSIIFENNLLRALGGNETVLPLMKTYFRIIIGFIWTQLLTVVMYFFVRIDGYPKLASVALIAGSVINIFLDYLLIVKFGWGIAGAAWATGFSQSLPFLILCSYFLFKDRSLFFSWQSKGWKELIISSFNGLSEFVNEISGSIIALLLNWLFMLRFGVDGVAAITVLNYVLMIGMMMVFSIGDSGGVFISQNFGARKIKRIREYLAVSVFMAFLIAGFFIMFLIVKTELLVSIFLSSDEIAVMNMASELVKLIWPVFAVNGFTMIVTSYLTALHLPVASAAIALCRSLLLPLTLLLLIFNMFPTMPFIIAIPISEFVSFILAVILFLRYYPGKSLFSKIQ